MKAQCQHGGKGSLGGGLSKAAGCYEGGRRSMTESGGGGWYSMGKAIGGSGTAGRGTKKGWQW